MYNIKIPSGLNINLEEYRNKVLGCWTGKNIGGTLGEPMESLREIHNLSFYSTERNGVPAPNDDLDLQLAWLQAVEENGLANITPRLLGEYWLDLITGPWGEYAVCSANIRNGFYPPLSGACNNEKWKYSNGAWIRSEIWACLFPGDPDRAAEMASRDACADHCGEGIYAEMFTAALEAAAFIISDIDELIKIALSKIPPDCRIARSVNIVIEHYTHKKTWLEAREAVVEDSKDIGWFQAPGNVAFAIIGLLYGEGDFGKTVCTAVNCGDDTDCTAATAGAVLGIINGRDNIPKKWTEPIGESIKTVAINPFPFNIKVPKTLDELTDRVINAAIVARASDPALIKLSFEPSSLSSEYLASLNISEVIAEKCWNKSPYELIFDLPYGELAIDYIDSPIVSSGKETKIKIKFYSKRFDSDVLTLKWHLPEGWQSLPGTAFSMRKYSSELACSIIPGEFEAAFCYIPLELQLSGRFTPVTLNIPFQLKDAVAHNTSEYPPEHEDSLRRTRMRQLLDSPCQKS